MPFTVSPEQAILFTKLSVTLVRTWPPSANSSKIALKVHDVLWHLSFISAFLLFFPLLQSCYVYQDDLFILSQSASLAIAVIQIPIKMTVCRTQQFRMQVLYSEMEEFCANASEEEKDVLQRYINRFKFLHGGYTLWTYFATLIVVLGPLYLSQPFPCFAVYPFRVDQYPIKALIYFHQSLVGFQAAAGLTVDCQVAILLWFATARFDMLGLKIQNLPEWKYLDDCYKYHQDVLRYTQKVQETTVFLAASTIVTTTVGVALGGINLIRQNTPLIAKAQFTIVMVAAAVELLICALPADHLKEASSQIANDMYNSKWYKRTTEEQTSALQLIMRAQKSEIISINGLFSDLSLRYYASFLYTSVSYVTALRLMLDDEET